MVRIIFPFLKYRRGYGISGTAISRKEGLRSVDDTTHIGGHHQSFRRKGGADRESASSVTGHSSNALSWRKLLQLWSKIAPLVQTIMPACTMMYYAWRLPKYLFPFSGAGKSGLDDMKWFGSLRSMKQPTWSEVFFVISVPTVVSLLVFTRLINPMPDLVAGSNVLKAVRSEAKAFGGVHNVSETF